MFRNTLKWIVIGLSLTAVLVASSGCDEEAAKAAVNTMKSVGSDGPATGGSLMDSGDVDPFVVALDIPFYIR